MKCANCGAEFEPNKYHPHQKYCCHKCSAHGYDMRHREIKKADSYYYRQSHKEQCRQQGRKYYQEHREEILAKRKIYYITGASPKGKLT
ncbi:MAG: hypothetical protein IJK81_00530 [Selenomonadaceae bacterium]|nr:hypothetical protein [Selenomonadaceae bacterium]